MNSLKHSFMLVTYAWLRFDPILWLAFRNRWRPRYEFMSTLFDEKDTDDFFIKRGKLVERRNKRVDPVLPSSVYKQVDLFLNTKPTSKLGRQKRLAIIEKLLFWATDSEINRTNVNSYQTRQAIIESLLGSIFQNAISKETDLILLNFKRIVFSKVTYLGSQGEQSPIVHNAIIAGVGRVLTAHFNEITRLRDQKLEKLTVVKMIKEIQKAKKETGSFAFSSGISSDKNNPYKNKFPLSNNQVRSLLKILRHYQFSAWPDSRADATKLIDDMEKQLGFKLEDTLDSQ